MVTTEQKLDRGGVIAALCAFGFWGLVPIYYKGLQSVGAWEVLAHRVIWSVPLLVIFLVIRDRGQFWSNLRLPFVSIAWLVLSGLTVSINWVVFVWAVANDHILDTSLGYVGTPLINVLLGDVLLKIDDRIVPGNLDSVVAKMKGEVSMCALACVCCVCACCLSRALLGERKEV